MDGPFINEETHKKLEESMQEGYKHAMRKETVAACREWLELWQYITETMDTEGFKSIEDLDQAYKGTETIYNWAGVFELELAKATGDDQSFAQHRIDFCREYIQRCRDNERDLNITNMKRAIGESHFRLGKRDEGDRIFSEYLKETPTWGWGWIGWADEYWFCADEEHKNSDKAIYLLNKALDVDGLEDREDVMDRLSEINEQLEKKKEADLISGQGMPMPQQPRIGRNELCPCGSGKKYKKCCQP